MSGEIDARRAALRRGVSLALARSLSGTADALEGLAAVIERRAPVFHGR